MGALEETVGHIKWKLLSSPQTKETHTHTSIIPWQAELMEARLIQR